MATLVPLPSPAEHLAINIQVEEQQPSSIPTALAQDSNPILQKPQTPPSSHAQVPFLLLISSLCMWSTASLLDNHLFTAANTSATAVSSHLWGFANLVQQAIFVPVMYVILTSARRKSPPAPIVWAFLLGIVSNTQSSTVISILSQFPLRLTSSIADGSKVAAVVNTQAVANSYHFAYAAYGGYTAMVGCHLYCHLPTVAPTGFTTLAQKIAFGLATIIHAFTIAIVITAPGDADAAVVSIILAVFLALLVKEAYATGSKALLPIGTRPVVQFYILSFLGALSTVGLAALYVFGSRGFGYNMTSYAPTPNYSLTM